jgi:hypothetical protein
MTAGAERSADPVKAGRRWKLGHQAFHVLLVVMNTRLDEAADLIDAEDWDAAVEMLDDLVVLYDGSTACMHYAADFRPEDYEQVIRPSMMPPFASPGFTGLANRDHETMIDGVKRIRAAMRTEPEPPPSVVAAWERLREAQKTNRANHMLVCRRFVEDGASLLGEFFREQREEDEQANEE